MLSRAAFDLLEKDFSRGRDPPTSVSFATMSFDEISVPARREIVSARKCVCVVCSVTSVQG